MRAFSNFKGSQTKIVGQKNGDLKLNVAEMTPLEKMLQNAGPIVPDGSDKFFGLENFGNTCYMNSVVQALFFSIPFREEVNAYPASTAYPASPSSTTHNDLFNGRGPPTPKIRAASPALPASPRETVKGITASEALKRRAVINSGQVIPGAVPKPEDKPDSPEYKKKQIMTQGPILDMTVDTKTNYDMEESIYTALKDIFLTLTTTQTSRTGVLSPQRLLEMFRRDNEMFRTSAHQDAHEFYGILLNAVINDIEKDAKARGLDSQKRLTSPANGNHLPRDLIASKSNHDQHMTNGNSPSTAGIGWVHDIFEGIMTSETKCLTCETASQRDETFLDLSIDLEQDSSVTACLRKFSAEEMLCERNKFHCDNCGGLQEAEKRMKIKKLPKILTLHLKRFKYTDDYSSMQKLFYRVVYPYQLRMFHTTDETEDPDRLYELYAVVIHIGANAYHGHYVSIIKTADRGWLLFDDELIEPVDKAYVRNFFGTGERTNQPSSQACAYVLFYQETTLEKVQKEQEAEGLAEDEQRAELGITSGAISPIGSPHSAFSSKRLNAGSPLIPTTPTGEEADSFASLNHVVTSPLSVPSSRSMSHLLSPPVIPTLNSTKMDSRAKDEREFQKKATKELEKAQKAAEKDRVKADALKKKELDLKEREYKRGQVDQLRATIAASKASAAEEEERRKREMSTPPGTSYSTSTADTPNGFEKKEGGLKRGLTLNRHKSMSRKSFLGFGRASSDMTSNANDSPGRPESQAGTPLEKPEKEKKGLFGLSRKKSTMI